MEALRELFWYLISAEGIKSVVASIAAAILTYVILATLRVRPLRLSSYLYWRAFAQDLVIVLSEVPIEYDPQVRVGEQPQLTPICDAMALADLLNFLRSTCKSNPQIVSVSGKADFDRIKHHNLLVIGGPKYNLAALELMTEIDNELTYQFKRIRAPRTRTVIDPDLKRFVSRRADRPDIVCAAEDEYDFGCIVSRQSPYVAGKRVMLVGGLSTLATLAATNWIRSRRFYFWLAGWWRPSGFEVIVRCRSIDRFRVSNVERVFFGVL